MEVSVIFDLVRQVAQQEAQVARFGEIQPEHFMMARLKLAELPADVVQQICVDTTVVSELALTVQSLRKAFVEQSIQSTLARRQLREVMGYGNAVISGRGLPRSPESRELFER